MFSRFLLLVIFMYVNVWTRVSHLSMLLFAFACVNVRARACVFSVCCCRLCCFVNAWSGVYCLLLLLCFVCVCECVGAHLCLVRFFVCVYAHVFVVNICTRVPLLQLWLCCVGLCEYVGACVRCLGVCCCLCLCCDYVDVCVFYVVVVVCCVCLSACLGACVRVLS